MLPARPASIEGNVTKSETKRIHIFEFAFSQSNLVAQALHFDTVLNPHDILHKYNIHVQ